MAFAKKFGKKFGPKQQSEFTTIGRLFKSKPEYVHENANYTYGGTVEGEYLNTTIDALVKIRDAKQGARFNLTKWKDNEHPVLKVSPAKSKGDSKRIGKEDSGFHGDEESEDNGL